MNQFNNVNSGKGKNNKDRPVRYNWGIKADMVRVLENGNPPRMMEKKDAVEYAESVGLDLVEVAFDFKTRTSTAKICDHGKYVYEQKQREKQAKKQARENKVEIKQVQISPGTDTADMNRIVENAKEFLADGDMVRFVMRFKSRRDLANMDWAKQIMKDALGQFDGLAVLDSKPTLAGRELAVILRPVKK